MLSKLASHPPLPKEKYEAEMEPLLLRLQRQGRLIYEANIPVLIQFEGWEGAGKGDVILETSTPSCPWTLVEANDKYWARIKVLSTVADAVEAGLEAGRRPDWLRV